MTATPDAGGTSPAGRWATAGLLVAALAWLGWGVSTVLARAYDAAHAADRPTFWRFWTPETAQLRSLLATSPEMHTGGAPVLVAAGPAGAKSDEVWHWAQYLAPETQFVQIDDAVDPRQFALRLVWGREPGDPDWIVVRERGPFRLERRGRTP